MARRVGDRVGVVAEGVGVIGVTGTLHYRGNVANESIGRIMGPTTVGEYLVIIAANYDAATDITTATLRRATRDDVKGVA